MRALTGAPADARIHNAHRPPVAGIPAHHAGQGAQGPRHHAAQPRGGAQVAVYRVLRVQYGTVRREPGREQAERQAPQALVRRVRSKVWSVQGLGGERVVPVTVMHVTRKWLDQQGGRRRRQQVTDARRGHASGRRTPFTGCGNCRREFVPGDVAVSKPRRINGKRYCAECAVRLGVCGPSEVRA